MRGTIREEGGGGVSASTLHSPPRTTSSRENMTSNDVQPSTQTHPPFESSCSSGSSCQTSQSFWSPFGVPFPHPHFPPIWSSVAPRALCPQHPSRVPTRPLLLPPLTRPPKGHNTHIVGLLLIRPNYTLSGLAPKPSPEAKTQMLRVGLVAGIYTSMVKGG